MVWGIGISILLLISTSHPCSDFVLYLANRVLFLGLQVNGRHTVSRWELGHLWSYVFNKLLLNCLHVPLIVFLLRTICEEDSFQDDRDALHFLMPGSWDWQINIHIYSNPIYDILFCGMIFWLHVTLHSFVSYLLKPRQSPQSHAATAPAAHSCRWSHWSDCEEIPNVQGQRSPSKMVGTDGQQNARWSDKMVSSGQPQGQGLWVQQTWVWLDAADLGVA